MNNDRHHDEQVSAAYQDLAKERTPEHLDHQVLRMAKANAGRPRYLRWIAWSRPLAWAATVALCLAITLEVTQVTTPDNKFIENIPAEVATPAAVRAPELQKDKREQKSDLDMNEQFKLAESMDDTVSSEKSSAARSAAKQAVSEPAAAVRMRQSADLAEAESIEEATVAPTMDFQVKEANELRREDGNVSAGIAASQALAADMPVNECSAESRSKPESWLECIRDLEAIGDAEAAARQSENLIEVFPDFKLP